MLLVNQPKYDLARALRWLTSVSIQSWLTAIDVRIIGALLQVEIWRHNSTTHIVKSLDGKTAIVDAGSDVSTKIRVRK